MNSLWILPAVSAQGAFAAAVVTDKVVLEHRRPAPVTLATATSVINVVIGLALLAVVGLPDAAGPSIVLMLAVGVALYVYLIPYFAALTLDDASVVGPLFQVVPVFTIGLSWLVLHEHLHGRQWEGIAIVVVGATIFTIGDGQQRWSIRRRTALLMTLSSALVAGALTGLDQVLRHNGYWQTMAVVALGVGASGLAVGVVRLPADGLQPFRSLGKVGWVGVATAEVLSTTGNGLLAFAVKKGSAPLASVVVGVEPLLLLVIGLALSAWLPQLLSERVSRRAMASKTLGSAAVIAGLCVLGGV